MLSRRPSARAAIRFTVAALLLTATLAAPGAAQDRDTKRDDAFTWSGTIPAGKRILIKNLNGGIQVERSTNGRVEVNAQKRWRRGNPEDVRIEQKTVVDDVLVCALFNEGSRCDENGMHTDRNKKWNDRNDVSVHFTVRVPDGVRVDLSTVNGGVEVGGVDNAVDAQTVNGSITVRSAGGPVHAKTVNGSINVSMGSHGRVDALDYETVNGTITLTLPSDFGAQLELSTVNGRVSTDFPITMSGTISPRRLRGTVGNGATRLRASTINGSVTLRKHN